jgi:hypothetical protein
MGVAAAGLIAVAIAFGMSLGSRSTTEVSVTKATLGGPSLSALSKAASGISIWEIHNQAHMENLPVQEVEDKTFVFTKEEPR